MCLVDQLEVVEGGEEGGEAGVLALHAVQSLVYVCDTTAVTFHNVHLGVVMIVSRKVKSVRIY